MSSPDGGVTRRPGFNQFALGAISALVIGLAGPAGAQTKDPGAMPTPPPPGSPPAAASDSSTPSATPSAASTPPPPAEPVKIIAGPPAKSYGVYAEHPASYLVEVGVSKSQVLDVRYPYTDLMLADPKVADVIPLSNHTVYIVAKAIGSTSLSVYGEGRRLIAAVNIVVGPDVEGFKARLHEIMPEETDVAVRVANQSLVLSGTASSVQSAAQVALLAETYAPTKVVNMLGVQGTQQVMLSVRFVEMERTAAKNLDVTITGTHSGNPFLFGDVGPAANINSSTPAFTPFLVPSTAYGAIGMILNGNIGLEIDALETKGVVKTLAEPTLVAMSGDTASFLAGGEFPIPISQAGSSTSFGAFTVQFQQFGISLAFTPTILKDGVINLVVKPEVSSLDPGDGVTFGGSAIPGIKVRRVSTTIELRDGESFTIAGLLSDSYQNTIRAFPWLGDTPVLGNLFRSPDFTRDKTELVIIVTPHLVTARRGRTALPTDHFTEPSDFELFLFGSLNGAHTGAAAEDRALMSRDPSKGGIDGPYGHVLY